MAPYLPSYLATVPIFLLNCVFLHNLFYLRVIYFLFITLCIFFPVTFKTNKVDHKKYAGKINTVQEKQQEMHKVSSLLLTSKWKTFELIHKNIATSFQILHKQQINHLIKRIAQSPIIDSQTWHKPEHSFPLSFRPLNFNFHQKKNKLKWSPLRFRLRHRYSYQGKFDVTIAFAIW